MKELQLVSQKDAIAAATQFLRDGEKPNVAPSIEHIDQGIGTFVMYISGEDKNAQKVHFPLIGDPGKSDPIEMKVAILEDRISVINFIDTKGDNAIVHYNKDLLTYNLVLLEEKVVYRVPVTLVKKYLSLGALLTCFDGNWHVLFKPLFKEIGENK